MLYEVSVIVPCYNIGYNSENEIYFQRAFNSLLNQTYPFEKIEIILVDDCSTDDTNQILSSLSNKYANVKLISLKKNSGPAISRNSAIEKASGNFIMFLDSDDQYNHNTIKKMLNTISNNNYDFILSNYSILMKNDKVLNYCTGNDTEIVTNKFGEDMKYMVKFFWTGIYNLNFLRNNQILLRECYGEDSLFLSECICKTNKNISLLNNFSSVIYTADNSKSHAHNFFKNKLLSYLDTFDKILTNYEDIGVHKSFLNSQKKDFILFILGFILRYNGLYDDFKIMVKESSDFLKKHNQKLNLRFHWKMTYILVLRKYNFILYLLSKLINFIFYQKWFVYLFRNDNYS